MRDVKMLNKGIERKLDDFSSLISKEGSPEIKNRWNDLSGGLMKL